MCLHYVVGSEFVDSMGYAWSDSKPQKSGRTSLLNCAKTTPCTPGHHICMATCCPGGQYHAHGEVFITDTGESILTACGYGTLYAKAKKDVYFKEESPAALDFTITGLTLQRPPDGERAVAVIRIADHPTSTWDPHLAGYHIHLPDHMDLPEGFRWHRVRPDLAYYVLRVEWDAEGYRVLNFGRALNRDAAIRRERDIHVEGDWLMLRRPFPVHLEFEVRDDNWHSPEPVEKKWPAVAEAFEITVPMPAAGPRGLPAQN